MNQSEYSEHGIIKSLHSIIEFKKHLKMKRYSIILYSVLLVARFGSEAQIVPFTSDQWEINARGHLIETYKGYEALYLKSGTAVLLDEDFRNGVIEFDMTTSNRISFSGLIFHIIDSRNYEEVYFRGHRSGNPDAYQYTPVFNGNSGWQLYHSQHTSTNDGNKSWRLLEDQDPSYNGVLKYAFDEWIHVKVVVSGKQAEIFLNNEEDPSVVIYDLKQGLVSGGIGVKSGQGAVHFANFQFRKEDDPVLTSEGTKASPELIAGVVDSWDVSVSFGENVLTGTDLPRKMLDSMAWKKVRSDYQGLVNLSSVSDFSRSTNTVFCKINIESSKQQILPLDFGYSDRVKVFINGILTFSGNNQYRRQDFRHLGTIGLHSTTYLPMRKGENEVIFAVSETFGGWGIMAKFRDQTGFTLK